MEERTAHDLEVKDLVAPQKGEPDARAFRATQSAAKLARSHPGDVVAVDGHDDVARRESCAGCASTARHLDQGHDPTLRVAA